MLSPQISEPNQKQFSYLGSLAGGWAQSGQKKRKRRWSASSNLHGRACGKPSIWFPPGGCRAGIVTEKIKKKNKQTSAMENKNKQKMNKPTDRQSDRQTNQPTDRPSSRACKRLADEPDRQTEAQTDRENERGTVNQTEHPPQKKHGPTDPTYPTDRADAAEDKNTAPKQTHLQATNPNQTNKGNHKITHTHTHTRTRK